MTFLFLFKMLLVIGNRNIMLLKETRYKIMKYKLFLFISFIALVTSCGGPPGPIYIKNNSYEDYASFISNYYEYFVASSNYDYFLFNLDNVSLKNYQKRYLIEGVTSKNVCDTSLIHCNELFEVLSTSLSFYDEEDTLKLRIYYQEDKHFNCDNIAWFIDFYKFPLNQSNYDILIEEEGYSAPLILLDSVSEDKLVTIERYNFDDCFSNFEELETFLNQIEVAARNALI